MILKRVQLTGFKSFAAKTTLELEPGITAIVGPNGSGKSNVADAVRWALGEQGKGKLRLSSSEEVIFGGTSQRPRGSYAEVVLAFNNEDGAFPLDLTEVEISRRLYRSGESVYRLAGRTVRLADITGLLLDAGVSAGSYTVIGQGMIDTFLLSSPAERKLLFDEAAGIRGPEQKREAAQRKLTATSTNLTRLHDIAAELEPRIAQLSQVAATSAEQTQLAERIQHLRLNLATAGVAYWRAQLGELEQEATALNQRQAELAADQATAAGELEALQAERASRGAEQAALQTQVAKLEQTRDQLAATVAAHRAELAEAAQVAAGASERAERLAALQAELAAATHRQHELETELAQNLAAASGAAKGVERAAAAVTKAQGSLVELRRDRADGSRDQYLSHALEVLKVLAAGLGNSSMKDHQVKILVHKAGRLLSHAAHRGAGELLAELQSSQRQLEAAMTKRETAIEHQTNVTITGRSLEIDLGHQRETVARLSDSHTSLLERHTPPEASQSAHQAAENQLAASQTQFTQAESQLAAARRRLHELAGSTQALTHEAGLVAAVERTGAALQAAALQAAQLGVQTEAAQAEHTRYQDQAAGWELALSEPLPKTQLTPAELSALQSQLVQAEAQLAARSSARADQLAEYQALTARHHELTSQISDLETAGADLDRVISDLGELIQGRFKDNFQTLSTQFNAYVGQLFGGGSASLVLQETAEGTYGIEIKVVPKGKRAVALAALSGGERSMAGVALLAAILKVNPSPFVVLDEIDAALDEANSGRLASIMHELAGRSQLIVITHNRQTMQAASVLFGVTLTGEHVSTLLSLRLEQATALAAR